MNILKEIILLLGLISLVRSHGHFFEPPTFNHIDPTEDILDHEEQGCNILWHKTYFTSIKLKPVLSNILILKTNLLKIFFLRLEMHLCLW